MGAAAQVEQAAGLALATSSPQTTGREWVLDAQFWAGGAEPEVPVPGSSTRVRSPGRCGAALEPPPEPEHHQGAVPS